MSDTDLILAIETSSRIGSVALGTEHKLIGQRTFSEPLRHSTELFPAIKDLLQQVHAGPPDITQVYVSMGPGSFTGLRIAASLAKAMHFATGIRIVAVDTLDVIVANAEQVTSTCPPAIAAVLDAKRGQFFVAGYKRNAANTSANQSVVWTKILEDCLMTAQAFKDKFVPVHGSVGLLGDGLVFNRDKFSHPDITILDESLWTPKAAAVYRLGLQRAQAGQYASPLDLAPNYLRAPQVTTRKTQAKHSGPNETAHEQTPNGRASWGLI